MGLEIECSPLESTATNDIMTNPSGNLTNCDEALIGNNGTSVSGTTRPTENEVLGVVNSPPLVVAESSSPTSTKGKGLKKWRRIKRDVSLDVGSNMDNSKLMKRDLSNFAPNSSKPMHFSADAKQTSEGSVSSTNAMLRSFAAAADQFMGIGESGLVIGPMLSAGTDSDNSSKSSTAASAPKIRHEMSSSGAFAREKNKLKNLGGKNLANSLQKGYQGKPRTDRTDTSKKHRGEVVKIEKENSHSSMESDLRTSHSVFVQGNYSATSNGRQSGLPLYGREASDEALGLEQEYSEELQAGSSTKHGDIEVNSSEKFVADTSRGAKDNKNENNGSPGDLDPLIESINMLQKVQQEFGKEVQKFRDIGKEDFFQDELSQWLESGEVEEECFDTLGSDVIGLKEMVDSLRSELDSSTALLEVKETRITELEGILNSTRPAEEFHPNYRDMELELERLFEQKIEAEVGYLVITRTIQKLRVGVVDQIRILEEQKKEQAQMLEKIGNAESKAATLKGESEKLEKFCEDIASADETLKLKTSVCKYTSCLVLQLSLFVIILAVFLWHLPPHDADVVPT